MGRPVGKGFNTNKYYTMEHICFGPPAYQDYEREHCGRKFDALYDKKTKRRKQWFCDVCHGRQDKIDKRMV
jgi:hypothetical protein